MAVLITKYIQVGSYYTSRGYLGSGYINFGAVSSSSGGTTGQNSLYPVYSSSTLVALYTSNNNTYLHLDIGDASNNVTNGVWDKIVVAGTTFLRTSATYTQDQTTGKDRWAWSISSDPFSSNGTWDAVSFETITSTTAPTTSSVTFNNPASANTTATVNLSASGSGGTLQYACEVGDSTPDNWQTSSTFTISRGSGTVYARARRSSTHLSSVVNATRPGFLIGDTGVNPSSSTIAHDATAASTTVVTYGTVGETYAVRVNNGSTNLGTAVAVSSSSAGTATISFTGSLPTAGNTTTYEIFVLRPTSTGGDGSTYHPTDDTFTVTRSAQAPTASSVTFNNPASTSIIATVNLSASGSGGTLQYALSLTDSTPDNWQSGSTFTISRGTGTVYARARRSSTLVTSVVSATRPPFLIGDTGVNPSSTTIAYSDTSETTTVYFGTAGETYAVRLNNGSTNLGTGLAPAGSPSTVSISFSTSLPSAGNSTTYEIFVRRPTSTGGDGSTYHATNDTFTVTRTAADVTPSDFDFTNQTGVALSSLVTSANTVTIGGMDTGVTASISISGGQYLKNINGTWTTQSGSSITATNGDQFIVRHTSSSSFSTSTTTTLTVGGVSGSFVSTTLGDNVVPVITVTPPTGSFAGTNAFVNVGDSYSDAGATATDNIDGNITSSIVTVNPVNTAVVGTYTVTYNVSDASGNAAVQKTRTVGVLPISPVVNNTQTFLTTGSSSTSCNVSLTSQGSGGTLEYNKSTSATAPTSGWQSSSTVTGLNRGTAYYLWARQATGYHDRNDSALPVPFLVGDIGVNPSSSTIDYDDTTASTTIVTYGTVGETYAVRVNNGSTNLGTAVAVSSSSAGTATISFTGSLPTAGNSTTYEIFVLRPISTGGDGSTYYPTDDTFTVTRDALPISPVVNNTQTFLTTASSSTSCVVSLTSSGSGGTLEYNKSTSTAVPTSGWQSSSTVTNLTRGTAYYLWARQATGYQDRTNSALTVPFLVGDTGVNPTNDTIDHDDTSASTVVTYGTYGEAYSVRVNNGSTNLGATIANSVGTATISFTSSLPTAGNSTTYEIFVRRPTATGGDESTYHPTNDTFTVTRSVVPITAPDAFTFTDVTNVALSSAQTSNTITVAGLNTSTSVSISGGTYSKNGGAYTSANDNTIVNGNTFAVRHTASGSFSTATNSTLNIGGVTDVYSSTTLAAITAPNPFAFTDKTGNVGTEQNSSALITGINTNSTVSRTSGTATFAVSSSASTPAASSFSSSAKTVNTSIDYVHVKQNASTSYSTTLSSSFAIGGVSDTWYVTSNAPAADSEPDQFSFTDVTTALSTVSYSYAQVKEITTAITVSRSSGAATFVISSSTSIPSSGFNSSNKTITNNQYIHVKQTSSSSNSTTLSSIFAAGGVSATWNLITVGAAGSGAGYGLQVFPPSGTIPRLDTTDRTVRVLGVHTGTLAAGGSSATVTQSGFSSSDATIGLEWQTSGDPQYASLSSSGTSLTIARSSSDPSSLSNTYQLRIFRI